ncbi:MAG: hypothetical protein MHPSP_002839 [Paramarteilia canceri]
MSISTTKVSLILCVLFTNIAAVTQHTAMKIVHFLLSAYLAFYCTGIMKHIYSKYQIFSDFGGSFYNYNSDTLQKDKGTIVDTLRRFFGLTANNVVIMKPMKENKVTSKIGATVVNFDDENVDGSRYDFN